MGHLNCPPPGSAFWWTNPGHDHPKAHRYVVLGPDGGGGVYLLAVMATSQVATRLQHARDQGLPPNTVVVVPAEGWSALQMETAFDTNRPERVSIQSLSDALARGQSRLLPPVPPELLQALVQGLLASPLVPPRSKAAIGAANPPEGGA